MSKLRTFYRLLAPRWLLKITDHDPIIEAQASYIKFLEEQLEIRGDQLDNAIDKWQWHKRRADRLHRRAQRAESILTRNNTPLMKTLDLHKRNVIAFEARLNLSFTFLRKVYPHLHTAWLHRMGSSPALDTRVANEISALEAELRREYPGVHEPIKPETFHRG